MANKTLSEVIAAKRDNLNDHPTTTLAAQIQRVAPQSVSFAVASPSAAIIGRHIFTQHVRLTKVRARLDDCGSADGPTTVLVQKVAKGAAESAKATCLDADISIAHDDTNAAEVLGVLASPDAGEFDFAPGDMLVVEVGAAATNAARLAVSVEFEPRIDT